MKNIKYFNPFNEKCNNVTSLLNFMDFDLLLEIFKGIGGKVANWK